MAPKYNALDAIARRESGWRNIHQNVVPPGGGFNPSTGTVTGPSSASGYFQMINPTWRSAAKLAGIDTSQYPTAMSAPYELQRKAAGALYAKEGFRPWAPYNAALRNDIAKAGGPEAFGGDDEVPSKAPARVTGQQSSRVDEDITPSGHYKSDDKAPGSFSEANATNEGDIATIKNNSDASAHSDGPAETLDGDSVSTPQAGGMGVPTDVPIAIVTAANQEAKTIAASAKTTAEAALKAAQTTTQSDAKLQGESQSWLSNWIARIFLFVVGATLIAGALFLLGGQTILQNKNPA